MKDNKQRRAPSCIALLLVLVLASPALLQARYKPTKGWNLFSRDQEVQTGKEAAAQVGKQVPVLKDTEPVSRYVQQLGQKLAAHAPGEKWPYEFHVVNQKEVNAFALPGGPIYVNLGTIQAADNEAQLAGVMSHEIAHVVQRHATRAATKQMGAQLPLAVLGGMMGKGIGAQLAQLGIQFGVGSYFLKNSRDAETEADLIGTDIMYDTGYNPQGMADFFRKLEAEGGARGPQFLSDHPNPGNRAARVAKEVKTLPAKKFQQDSAEFQNIKRQVAGMKPLSAQEIAQQQKQGSVGSAPASAVTPSKNFKPFEHSAYNLSYPDNWEIFGDQNSSVTIAPRAGVGENAIAYGVIVDGFQPEQGRSLDQATHDLLERLRQGNPDLKTIGGDEDIQVNGVKGKSVDLVGPSQIKDQTGKAERERDWLVALPRRDGSLLYLVFIAPERDFNAMHPAFQNMLRSLRLK